MISGSDTQFGDKRKFTYSDASEKNQGYGPDNDLSFTTLEIQ